MSTKAREQAREHGQTSGKGTQSVSRLLAALGVTGTLAYVLGRSDEENDAENDE